MKGSVPRVDGLVRPSGGSWFNVQCGRLLLAMFAVFSFFFFVASLRTDMVLLAIFALITIGLVLLSVGAGTTTPDLTKPGDWVTLVFAILA